VPDICKKSYRDLQAWASPVIACGGVKLEFQLEQQKGKGFSRLTTPGERWKKGRKVVYTNLNGPQDLAVLNS
jgi:hypothetical protein